MDAEQTLSKLYSLVVCHYENIHPYNEYTPYRYININVMLNLL